MSKTRKSQGGNRKRCYIGLLAGILFVIGLLGCSSSEGTVPRRFEVGIQVVCSNYAAYDWTCNLIKGREDAVQIKLLADNGVDMHSYQPTIQDIASIKEADLVIHVGGISDGWISDALKDAGDTVQVINMMEVVGDRLLMETTLEGMEEHSHSHEEHEELGEAHSHEEHEESGEAHDHEGHLDHTEYDEHVWLSLENASLICASIKEAFISIDPEGQECYQQNYDAYLFELEKLSDWFSGELANCSKEYLVFADRFPMRYLLADYDIAAYAAFPGCSSDSSASFETVLFLANKVQEGQLSYVLAVDGNNTSIADAVISNTADHSQSVLVLTSMQSVQKNWLEEAGVNYLSLMEDNLMRILEALK